VGQTYPPLLTGRPSISPFSAAIAAWDERRDNYLFGAAGASRANGKEMTDARKPLLGNLDIRLANLPLADVPNIVARMRELGILKKPLRLAAPPVAMTAPSANAEQQ
jgi:hypothetical protein